MMNISHSAGCRIFYRHHGQGGTPVLNRAEHVFKRGTGNGIHIRFYSLTGHMRIGPRHTLKSYFM
jgi:hypothetical protein